jgi:hypothetical protein
LVGGDCAWVDGDGEDTVGDGRRDEFADGEFFGVKDAKRESRSRARRGSALSDGHGGKDEEARCGTHFINLDLA